MSKTRKFKVDKHRRPDEATLAVRGAQIEEMNRETSITTRVAAAMFNAPDPTEPDAHTSSWPHRTRMTSHGG